MPLYKLHEAPRATPSFGGPVPNVVPSNRMPIDAANRIPHHPHATASLQPQLPMSSPAALAASSSSSSTTDSSSSASTERPPLPALETAHFGHSLYFIEHLFPSKLWRILDDAERCGYADVISWVDNGMAFQIHDRESVIPILEKYFSMSKYKSFLRQLQAYGFQRALPNPKDDPCRDSKPKKEHHRGKWSHKLFRRDKMNLCNKMTRDGKTKQDKDDFGRTATTGVVKKEPISPESASSSPQSPPQQPGIHPNQAAIAAKHHQHQKDLAAQQHQQQQQLQLMHNRMLQQQHHPLAPPPHPPVYRHDPRFPHHPPPQHPAFHHHPQQQHMQQRLHPQHHRLPHHPLPPPGAAPGLPPSILARVQQQQKEEHHRQQLQLQINQLKEQQLITSILNSRGEAPAAPPASRIPGVPAPAPQTLLAGVNYNKPAPNASPPVVAAAKGATEAVSEAANELRRAELTLAERRWRLAEAQDRAKQEAQALAKAEAAIVKARGAPAPSPSQALAAQSTTAALLRQHNQQPASASSPSGTKRPAPQSLGTNEGGARKRMVGGHPLTSILEDLDNAFQSSALPAQKHTGKKTNQDLLKITEEELLRAKVEAAKPPLQQQLVHRPSSSAASPTRNASPGPSAAEREVIIARINAMEKIRLREQQQQQQQQQQQMGRQQFLMKIAASEREAAIPPKRGATSVRDAIRNAGVGLVSGEAGASPSLTGATAARLPGSIEGTHSTAADAMLSKEMMEIFAKTAAAAISSKRNDESSSNGGSANASQAATAANSRDASPPTTGPPTLKAAASLVAKVAPSAATHRSEASAPLLPSKVPSSALTAAKPTVLPSSSHVVTTSELEAARELMRIPGAIEQTSKEPMRGHWELVKPEELKKRSALTKALPDVVSRSSGLTYDAYKAMSQNLTPPKVMRIPKEWDATKEPVYLVVDPANATESALPPTSMATGGVSAATLATSKSGASSAVSASLAHKLEQAAGTPAGLR